MHVLFHLRPYNVWYWKTSKIMHYLAWMYAILNVAMHILQEMYCVLSLTTLIRKKIYSRKIYYNLRFFFWENWLYDLQIVCLRWELIDVWFCRACLILTDARFLLCRGSVSCLNVQACLLEAPMLIFFLKD